MLDSLFHGGTDSGLFLLIAMLTWFFKRQLKIYDKHLEVCDSMPKGTILAKLDSVCDQIRDMHTSIAKMADSQAALNTQVAVLIGRQAERDSKGAAARA